MDTWDAIRARRNVRSFQDRPIVDEHLERILEAGRRTPSSRNRQPWHLIVVTERERLQALAGVWQGAGHVASSAASIAVVAPATDDPTAQAMLYFDLGQLMMAMMLAATDLGIGSAHAWVQDQDLARDLLGLPEGWFLAWLLALGHPGDRPLRPVERPDRRPLDEVVHRERW